VFVPFIFLQAHLILQVYGLMALFFEIICVLQEMLLSSNSQPPCELLRE
jgi:hypothetical protein